jgi:hypothetical protein
VGTLADLPPARTLVDPALPGEGRWEVVDGTPSRPALAVARLRPDPAHTSVVVALARLDPSLVRLQLLAGATDPPGGPPDGGRIPDDERRALLAAFNSGFEQREARGGWYAHGVTAAPLVAGRASLVIRNDGTATVGAWGRDASMGPDVAAVRQNLDLIVDGGGEVPGLGQGTSQRWGATLGHQVLVWRSGLGVTADGALVYAGGPDLSITTLADALVAAGCVRAMELDINSAWVSFLLYRQAAGGVTGVRLLPAMKHGPERYLGVQPRDLVVVLAR